MTIIPAGAPRRSRPSAPSPVVIAAIVCVLVALVAGAYALTRPAAPPPASVPPAKVAAATPKATATSPVAPSSGAAAAAIKRARAAALAAGWAHVAVTVKHGSAAVSIAQDSGISDGAQRIAMGAARVTVLVIADRTFVSGNRAGLAKMYRASAADLRKWTGHWLRLLPGDGAYAGVTKGVTMASVLDETTVRPPFTMVAARTLHGQKVIGVRGKAGADQPASSIVTLWIAVDTYLPVEYQATSADGGSGTTAIFSKWGTAVDLTAPDNLVVTKSRPQIIGA